MATTGIPPREPGNIAKIVWPLALGGLVWSTTAARSRRGWAPLAFAGAAGYAVYWAMENQKDYLRVSSGASRDFVPF